jgi:hypothetical protein
VAIGQREGTRRTGSITEKTREYWLQDDSADWFEVGEYRWAARSKADAPWTPEPDRTVDGAIQRFEGGTMLFLPKPDGPGTVLVLSEPDHGWRERPDTP